MAKEILSRDDKKEIIFRLTNINTEASEAKYQYEELDNLRECRSILSFLRDDTISTIKYIDSILHRLDYIDSILGKEDEATQPSSIGHYKVDDILEDISIDDIKNAKYGSSFMDDRASINIDNKDYIKIGKNKWQYSPAQSHALGSTYSDNDIYNLIKNSKNIKFSEGIEMKSNKYVESLVKMSDPEQFGDNCRKAWKVDNQYINESPVIIEYREYFDNWNDKLYKEYAVHFDESNIPEYFDYDEYYFDKLKDAKSYAYELIDQCKDYIDNECYNNELVESPELSNFDKLKALMYTIEKYLYKNHIRYDDEDFNQYTNTISFSIDMGDWKYDHMRLKNAVSDFCSNNGIKIDRMFSNEDDNGSDVYNADHYFSIDVDTIPYDLIKDEYESSVEYKYRSESYNEPYDYDDEEDEYLDEDVTVSPAEDNGNYITIDIGNTRYEYTLKDDCPYDIYDLVYKFNGIRKHSHGRALAWIKKYATGKKVGIKVEARNTKNIVNSIYNQCYEILSDYMKSEGFDEREIDEYSTIDVNGNKNEIVVNVRAELSYDGMSELSDRLNNVVSKYDKNSYFDMVDSGIIEATVEIGDSVMRESNEYDFCEEVLLKDVSRGEYFTLKPIEDPRESQVYIKGEYDREEKKYECGRFDDISYSRYLPGNKKVYIGFTF